MQETGKSYFDEVVDEFQSTNAERWEVENEADQGYDDFMSKLQVVIKEHEVRLLAAGDDSDAKWWDDLHTLHMIWTMELEKEGKADPTSWKANFHW